MSRDRTDRQVALDAPHRLENRHAERMKLARPACKTCSEVKPCRTPRACALVAAEPVTIKVSRRFLFRLVLAVAFIAACALLWSAR